MGHRPAPREAVGRCGGTRGALTVVRLGHLAPSTPGMTFAAAADAAALAADVVASGAVPQTISAAKTSGVSPGVEAGGEGILTETLAGFAKARPSKVGAVAVRKSSLAVIWPWNERGARVGVGTGPPAGAAAGTSKDGVGPTNVTVDTAVGMTVHPWTMAANIIAAGPRYPRGASIARRDPCSGTGLVQTCAWIRVTMTGSIVALLRELRAANPHVSPPRRRRTQVLITA